MGILRSLPARHDWSRSSHPAAVSMEQFACINGSATIIARIANSRGSPPMTIIRRQSHRIRSNIAESSIRHSQVWLDLIGARCTLRPAFRPDDAGSKAIPFSEIPTSAESIASIGRRFDRRIMTGTGIVADRPDASSLSYRYGNTSIFRIAFPGSETATGLFYRGHLRSADPLDVRSHGSEWNGLRQPARRWR